MKAEHNPYFCLHFSINHSLNNNMINSNILPSLLKEWADRYDKSDDFDYKVAISECIDDLKKALKEIP